MSNQAIKISDDFDIERDEYCWHLHEWKAGKDKNGNPKRRKVTTYYATLRQISNAIIDRSAGKAKALEEMADLLEHAETKILDCLNSKGS